MYSALLKTHIRRINQGNRDRKFGLCIKGCSGSKKSTKYEIPRELNIVEN